MLHSGIRCRRSLARAHALSSSRHVGMDTGYGCASWKQAAGSRASSIVELRHADETRSVIHVFAAMAINTELRGATS